MTKDAVAEISQQYLVEAAEKRVPEGYKQTEVGVIPEDWEAVTLGTVGEIKMCKRIFKNQTKDVAGVPFYKIGTFGRVPDAFISKELFEDYKRRYSYPVKGEVLISAAGTIGRTVVFDGQPSYFQDSNIIWINNDESKVLNSYLWHYYKVVNWTTSEGGIVSRLYNDNIRNNVFIAYPAITEQKRISTALSDAEILINELEKLIAKKQAIKTATMQQLLTGRTRLPQFALHPDGSKKGYKQSELGEIPEDWRIRTYGDIFSFLTTSTNSRSDLSDNGEYGYIHYGDIHTLWNSFLDLNKSTTPKIEAVLVRSAFIQDGDLVMADASEDYEGIGKSIEIKNIGNKSIVAGLHTYLLRDSHSFFVDGFRGYLHEIPAVKSMINKLATGMKVYGISKGNLEGIYLPMPSKQEQTAIATILSDMDAEIQALEQRLNKNRQIKQGMMQQLLTGKIRLLQPAQGVSNAN